MNQAGDESEDLGPWAARALTGARRVAWLKGLADEELLALVRAGRVQLWRDQDMVTTPAERSRAVFLVLEGSLRALVQREDGSEFLLSDFGAGETAGMVSLYRETIFPHAMRALGATLTLRLSRAQLEQVVLRHPQSGLVLLEMVSLRMAMSLQFLALTALSPLREQLHGRLEIWAVQQELRGQPEPHVLHGSQRELAAMMGASRQSVNTALHELETAGVLKMSYGRIILLQRPR
ncbi:MAG: Crp/Fnr family transcriptional regulator [Betaproteobacteria bacterium]|nr:Crp/Fnr family transcriptional regulator [Betaproteobacteria bacterium]